MVTPPHMVSVKRWLAFAGLGSAYSASIVDTTVVHLALPTISQQFAADLLSTSWIVHSYNIVFAACLITAGKLADAYGHKRILLLGLSLFSVASLCCALAPSLPLLLLLRAVQALGGASLGSVGFALVVRIFPQEQRSLPLSIWSALAALSAIMGPMIGGVLLAFSWRWIFLINLPICLLSALLSSLLPTSVPGSSPRRGSFDLAGMSLFVLLLTSFILLVIEEWQGFALLALLLIVTLNLAGWLFVEWTSAVPFLDFSLFGYRSFLASNLGMFLFWTAYQGATLILSLYLLNAQHLSANTAALFLIPVPLANIVLSLLLNKHGTLWLRAVIGSLCGCIGFVGLALFGTIPLIVVPALLIGASASLCFVSFHSSVLSEVPLPTLGQASGIFNTARQLSTTLGAALLLRAISWQLQAQFAPLARSVQAIMPLVPLTAPGRFAVSQQAQHIFSTLTDHQGSTNPLRLHLLGVPLWDTWFSQQLQASIVTAFSHTWLLCALLALSALPLAVALRSSGRKTPPTVRGPQYPSPTKEGGPTHATTRP